MNSPASEFPAVVPGRRRRVAAIILLVVAAAGLAEFYLPSTARLETPLLLGVGFLVWAALARRRGLLVPGGVLTGIGVGALLRPEFGEAAVLFSLASGFLLIPVLSLVLFGRGGCWAWPLFPAAGFLLAALAEVGGPEFRDWLRTAVPFWPFLLIAIALYLLLTPRAVTGPGDKR